MKFSREFLTYKEFNNLFIRKNSLLDYIKLYYNYHRTFENRKVETLTKIVVNHPMHYFVRSVYMNKIIDIINTQEYKNDEIIELDIAYKYYKNVYPKENLLHHVVKNASVGDVWIDKDTFNYDMIISFIEKKFKFVLDDKYNNTNIKFIILVLLDDLLLTKSTKFIDRIEDNELKKQIKIAHFKNCY